MAGNTNAVDAVVAQEAIKQIDVLISKLSQADAELIKISESALKAGKGISSISTPSGMDSAVNNTAALNAELAKQSKQIEALKLQITKLAQVKAINNKMSAEEAVNQRILNQNALTHAKSVSNLVGEYDKLNIKHQQALKNAQNIGAQYGATSKQFLDASEKANKLDKELKNLDFALGKHSRNVGNYTGSYNALGNSINQLSREAPAFANSLNTGFMAISNNLPALSDAIKGIREENKRLEAEGSPTVSVLEQLAEATFSWQTAISVGITLLTVYGGAIVEWVTGTKEQLSATEELTEAIRRQNEEITNYNETITHQGVLAMENAKQRGAAAKEIDAIERKSTEDQLRNLETIRNGLERQYYLAKTLREDEAKGAKDFDGHLITRIKNRKDFIEAQKLTDDESFEILKTNLKKSNEEVAKQGFVLSELVEKQQTSRYEEAKKAAKKIKETTPKVQELESNLKSVGTVIDQINGEIDRLKVEKITGDDAALPAINFQLEQMIKLKQQLEGMPEADFKIVNTTTKSAEALKKLSEEQKRYLESFSRDLISQTGFTETFNILSGKVEGFGEDFKTTFVAIAESAQEVFNFINQNSEANFNAEKSRLKEQYDVSLKYAGDNKAAKEKLAEDFEKKQKELEYREAKAKQKQAIFNIAIDTAQAIMATLGQAGFAGIPLSLIVGAIGAAQIAMVAAQDIPRYFDGGVHGGGLAMINDAGGSNYVETVVTPDGKARQYKGRDVVTDLPSGTEIFTPEQWREKQLQDMLSEKGISMSRNYQSSGMTAQEMDLVMSKHFSKIQVNNTTFDKNGIRSWSERNGNKTINSNARGEGRGFLV